MSFLHNNDSKWSRRAMLKLSACASVGTTSLLNTMMSLRQVSAAVESTADDNDFKALVCVFLYGGNDASNMLIPMDPTQYDLYTQWRSVLALPSESLLTLDAYNDDGRELGMHPSMPGISSLFAEEKAAVIQNVGTLYAPATLSDYRNRSSAIPPHLFSHNDQQVLWQTNVAGDVAFEQTGWGGRIADLLNSSYNQDNVTMHISLDGANFFQTGETILPFRVGAGGNEQYYLGNGGKATDEERYAVFRRLLERQHANLMEQTFADLSNRAIRDSDKISNALEGTAEYPEIPNSRLGQQLRTVAKLIEARAALGMRRQIYFCATGGFDTHGPQLDSHAGLLGGVDAALTGFYRALEAQGTQSGVTTFTASDFGRTFDSNGRGSDHGWGSHHVVIGDDVVGKNLYGEYPDLAIDNNPLDTGRGRWLPTTSVDQYGATMAKWFGVPESQLNDVFPNLHRFSNRDLGFMKSV